MREIGTRTKIAALTRSEKGSVIVAAAEPEEIAVDPVAKVVDTTGAGDQYAAGFLFGLARGKPLAACGRLGEVDRSKIRAEFEQRFTARRMAQDYVDIYQRLIDQRRGVQIAAE